MLINRRGAFGLLGLGAAATATTEGRAEAALAFSHGVASGDPLQDRAIIWTRLTAPASASPAVKWEVASDEGFKTIARRGTAVAEPARDHTVKVDVDGLSPGRTYWYRFTAGKARSPVGRLRTLPAGATSDVVLAVASCALHPGGLFNAYAAIAELERVDAVVHLGDYIYEYGSAPDDYGMASGLKIGRIPDPPHEIVRLADYRRRHAQYKADPDLQAAHARAAWICVWDDHESANDCWVAGAENHSPAAEGAWSVRKAAALKAYYEWMPIREPAPGRAYEAANRSFDFGDLATLVMVETRLLARAEQLEVTPELADPAKLAGFQAQLSAPDRRLLGDQQEAWLGGELQRSRQSGRVWQVIGNQVVMARVNAPDVKAAMPPAEWAAAMATLAPETVRKVEGVMMLAKLGVPLNLDAWDGYPVARERLYAQFRQAKARPVVLAGDSHAFWVNALKDASGVQVAAEFGTSSITSPSWGDAVQGFDLGGAVAQANDEVVLNDQAAKGFIRLTLTREAAVGELIAVSTIYAKPFTTRIVATYQVTPLADGGVSAPTPRAA